MSNQLLSRQIYEAAREHELLEHAAKRLEEGRSAYLAREQEKYGDIPVSRSELKIKASDSYKNYLDSMLDARHQANLSRIEVDRLRAEFSEQISAEANHRIASRVG